MGDWNAATVALMIGWLGFQAGAQPTPLQALAQAEARWQQRKPSAYEFHLEVRCFCDGLLQRPVGFHVDGNEARPLQDLEAAARMTYEYYDTIEKLFAAIRRSLARGEYKVLVEYDPDFGYPVNADLDPKKMTFDDELFFRVSEFRKIGAAPGLPNRRLQPGASALSSSEHEAPRLSRGRSPH
jgi:hypothetical protein